MSYATWEDVVGRYKELNKLGGDTEVNSSLIYPAEKYIDTRLGKYFTVPFSSNNYTAKDLTIEVVYWRYYQTINKEKAELKKAAIDEIIDALIDGSAVMATTSGSLDASASISGVGYSNTMSYHPVFGIGDIREFHPDSAQLYNEENTRDY